MIPDPILWRSDEERREIFQYLFDEIEAYRRDVATLRVEPMRGRGDPRALAEAFDFSVPMDPRTALARTIAGLKTLQVHPAHPGYFGLFNPATSTMGIAADTLVAAFNPQLATHSHSPFAVEVERHLVRTFAAKFGLDPETADGTFCTGGAEANHTALLTALRRAFPTIGTTGLRGLPGEPTLYVTTETHDSFIKAARLCGLGAGSVRVLPVDGAFRMDLAALRTRLDEDRTAGRLPFLVVATAGTTSGGAIDPLGEIAELVATDNASLFAPPSAHATSSPTLSLHVDAAWGGAAALLPELKNDLAGIERADSITLDAHKWLSVPMGAGLFLTRHPALLGETFSVDAEYMPARREGVPDPYLHSIQWSRRFIGLKVLLSLAVAGWDGYAATLRHQVAMGDALRARLIAAGYRVTNDTRLPLVCFVDGQRPDGDSARYLSKAMLVVTSEGKSWISVTRLGQDKSPALRACITNYGTTERELDHLVTILLRARAEIAPTG